MYTYRYIGARGSHRIFKSQGLRAERQGRGDHTRAGKTFVRELGSKIRQKPHRIHSRWRNINGTKYLKQLFFRFWEMKSISSSFRRDWSKNPSGIFQLDSFWAILTFNVLKCIGGSISLRRYRGCRDVFFGGSWRLRCDEIAGIKGRDFGVFQIFPNPSLTLL